MNPDDYDEDGNNIVPCPICLDRFCPSNKYGKCPEEDEFVRDMSIKELLGEQWQTKFLNAGTEKGLGDLSMMIGVVSEILTANSVQARQAGIDEAVETVDTEAIQWAYKKLLNYGSQNVSTENAMMMDRVNDTIKALTSKK